MKVFTFRSDVKHLTVESTYECVEYQLDSVATLCRPISAIHRLVNSLISITQPLFTNDRDVTSHKSFSVFSFSSRIFFDLVQSSFSISHNAIHLLQVPLACIACLLMAVNLLGLLPFHLMELDQYVRNKDEFVPSNVIASRSGGKTSRFSLVYITLKVSLLWRVIIFSKVIIEKPLDFQEIFQIPSTNK